MSERNGFNLDQLEATIEAVRNHPEAGDLEFRANYTWRCGFAGDTRFGVIEHWGRRIPRSFRLTGDYPPELLGSDYGPSPLETLMGALASCLAGTYAAQAAANDIEVETIDIELQSSLDLGGFFQLASVRPGPPGIKVRLLVRSTADETAVQELHATTIKTSPLYDALVNPVPIETEIERSEKGGSAEISG